MTKKELTELKQQRRMLQASLELNTQIEVLRDKFKLSRWEAVELLYGQSGLYLRLSKWGAHGRR